MMPEPEKEGARWEGWMREVGNCDLTSPWSPCSGILCRGSYQHMRCDSLLATRIDQSHPFLSNRTVIIPLPSEAAQPPTHPSKHAPTYPSQHLVISGLIPPPTPSPIRSSFSLPSRSPLGGRTLGSCGSQGGPRLRTCGLGASSCPSSSRT